MSTASGRTRLGLSGFLDFVFGGSPWSELRATSLFICRGSFLIFFFQVLFRGPIWTHGRLSKPFPQFRGRSRSGLGVVWHPSLTRFALLFALPISVSFLLPLATYKSRNLLGFENTMGAEAIRNSMHAFLPV